MLRREVNLLLPLEVVGCISLEANNGASIKLTIVNNMICLRGKHALDVVLAITHHQPVSISTLRHRPHLLDLQTLQNRYGKSAVALIGLGEYGT